MSFSFKNRKFFLLFVILLPVCSIAISLLAHRSKDKLIHDQLPVYSSEPIPDFKLVAHTGETITRKNLEGKIVVADFFFTNCRGMCPKMSNQMARVMNYLTTNEEMRQKIVLLSHTVDPASDSVPVLKAYADLYGADGKVWYLVTGEKQQLYDLSIKFYKLIAEEPKDSNDIYAHTPRFTLLDTKGYIRGYYDGTDSLSVDQLMRDIGRLDLLDRMFKKKDEEKK